LERVTAWCHGNALRRESGDEPSYTSGVRDTLVHIAVGIADDLKRTADDLLQRSSTVFHCLRQHVVREQREVVVSERMEADLHLRLDELTNVRSA